jgi:hypothetical protein
MYLGINVANKNQANSPIVKQPAPTVPTGAPRSTAYKINPFTQAQLAQFSPQQGLLNPENKMYQQYLAKMAGYGAGAGKTTPAVSTPTTQGASNV